MVGIELTPEARQNIRDTAGRNLRDFIFGAQPGNTLDGTPVPEWLAGPEPSNPLSKWQWDNGREICNRWAAGKTPQILPGREAFYRNTCSPYIEDNFGPVPDGSLEPPFTGGQCAGVSYDVKFNSRRADLLVCNSGVKAVSNGSADNRVGGRSYTGPITSMNVAPAEPQRCGFLKLRLTIVSASGTFQVDVTSVPSGNPTLITGGSLAGLRAERVTGTQNCGNPPPLYDPGSPLTGIPGPAPIPQPPGTPWPFPGFKVDVNPDGTINVDFGDGGPTETIDPTSDPGGGGEAIPPGDQGQAGDDAATGEGGDAEGEAPEGSVIVGLLFELIAAPPNASQFAPEVFRAAAYIYMGGNSGLDLLFAGGQLRDGQFVYAPVDNCTKWRVKANPGYNWRITPFYREVAE